MTTVGAGPSGIPGVPSNRRAPQLGQVASVLLCMGLSLSATACGASIDGDQWVNITVTNTTAEPVTLDTHPVRYLPSGQKTVLNVNSNDNPQAVRVDDAKGRVLGRLTFRTTSPRRA